MRLGRAKGGEVKELSAFRKYLLKLPIHVAVAHVIDCLQNGEPRSNEAWRLMEELNGEKWSIEPEELPKLILETIVRMGNLHYRGNEAGLKVVKNEEE